MALENKLGITDSTELARAEEKISKRKAIDLFESGHLKSLKAGTYQALAGVKWTRMITFLRWKEVRLRIRKSSMF